MILALLQARTSSTRLPGKVLLPILGKAMLLRQIERVRRAQRIDRLIVVTSNTADDDGIELLCRDNDIPCFRGELDDVLDRFYQAALELNPEHVVRLTGDCPLADPELIDQVVAYHLANCFDYTSNCQEPSFPDGLDVEIFRFSCLAQAWREARLTSQREHVTPFIRQHPCLKIGSFKSEFDHSRLRWTVDEPIDFEVISRIYEALHPLKADFTMADILAFLEVNPHLKTLNTRFARNEGYEKSLREDGPVLKESH
jgi:spore coat polysaccharide biosynthesis protein SpsF